jgi:flagella basal body P-ring formation protein FlgA
LKDRQKTKVGYLHIFPLLLLFSTLLFAAHTLKPEYGYSDHRITSETLFPGLGEPFELFSIPPHKTRYRISAETIIDACARRGVAVENGGHRYITFLKKSPVDTGLIETKIAAFYSRHYPTITLHRIEVTPRVYTPSLPAGYRVVIPENSYKSGSGTLYAEGPSGKKFFFDYRVNAEVGVLRTRNRLKRDSALSPLNTKHAAVPLEHLRSLPLTEAPAGRYRLKRSLKADALILMRHVERAPLVNRGSKVSASLRTGQVLIQFHGIALQDGALHDIISIQKPDGQRIRAKVVGENKVVIE